MKDWYSKNKFIINILILAMLITIITICILNHYNLINWRFLNTLNPNNWSEGLSSLLGSSIGAILAFIFSLIIMKKQSETDKINNVYTAVQANNYSSLSSLLSFNRVCIDDIEQILNNMKESGLDIYFQITNSNEIHDILDNISYMEKENLYHKYNHFYLKKQFIYFQKTNDYVNYGDIKNIKEEFIKINIKIVEEKQKLDNLFSL